MAGECDVCGRVKWHQGIALKDVEGSCDKETCHISQYDGGAECYRLGYERTRTALAAATEELALVKGIRAAIATERDHMKAALAAAEGREAALRGVLVDVQTTCRKWLGMTAQPLAQKGLLKIHELVSDAGQP